MKIVKYAYLVFHLPFPFPQFTQPFRFDDFTELRASELKSQLENPDAAHWGKWLGSITWDSVCQSNLILSTWKESENPEVLDLENQALQNRLWYLFQALPLTAPFRPPDDVFLFSGVGRLNEKGVVAKDLRSFSQPTNWIGAFFIENAWDEFFRWAREALHNSSILEAWRTCSVHLEHLFLRSQLHRQLFEGFRSFEEAMKTNQLEFKIPHLVRSIEAIVVCKGFKEFAKSTLALAGPPEAHLPFKIANNTEELLRDLYQLRNDCSHGKPFAYSLEKKLGRVPEPALIAKYEFLGEWAARKIINDSLINPSVLQYSKDRDGLADAWTKGLVKRQT